jgi:hypothetical protein
MEAQAAIKALSDRDGKYPRAECQPRVYLS